MVFQIVDCMVCSLYRAHAVLIPCFIASRTCFHPPSRAGRYSTGIFYKDPLSTWDEFIEGVKEAKDEEEERISETEKKMDEAWIKVYIEGGFTSILFFIALWHLLKGLGLI